MDTTDGERQMTKYNRHTRAVSRDDGELACQTTEQLNDEKLAQERRIGVLSSDIARRRERLNMIETILRRRALCTAGIPGQLE